MALNKQSVPVFIHSKTKVIFIFALVLALLLSGCFGSKSTPKITIIGEDSSNLQAMEALKSIFEQRYNIEVNFVRDPFDLALQKSNQDLANKTGQYDIICQYAASLAPFVSNNYVYTLDDMEKFVPSTEVPRTFEKDFFPGVWRETGFYRRPSDKEPTRVSYPFAATTMMLVYNKRLFNDPSLQQQFRDKYKRELLPPTTWDEYLLLAEFFTDPKQNRFGVVMEGAPGGYLYWEWCNYAYGMGGGVMKKEAGWEGDAATPILLDSEENVAATKLFLSLKKFNAGDFFSTGSAEKREIFLSNNVAMSIMWSDYIPEMLKHSRAGEIGFAPIPGDKSMLGGATFFLNRSSKHPREATQYILSLMQRDIQVQLMQRGLASPFRSVYEAEEVKNIPYSAALKGSLERGVYMIESGPDSQTVQDIITDKVQAMWRGAVEVREGLQAAKSEIEVKRKMIFTNTGAK